MRRLLSLVLVAVSFLSFAPAAYAAKEGIVGTILEVEGTATVQPAVGDKQAAMLKAPVHLNDIIETAAGSRVMILFIDDTQIVLSEKTKFAIDEYIFDAGDTAANKGVYSILSGAVSYVSGLITKVDNPDVTINTAAGTIGIHGTKLWFGSIDKDYGLFVDEGMVDLVNEGGEAFLRDGEGTTTRGIHFALLPAQKWDSARVDSIKTTTSLKNAPEVEKRIAAMQTQLPEMRAAYRVFLIDSGNKGIKAVDKPSVWQENKKGPFDLQYKDQYNH